MAATSCSTILFTLRAVLQQRPSITHPPSSINARPGYNLQAYHSAAWQHCARTLLTRWCMPVWIWSIYDLWIFNVLVLFHAIDNVPHVCSLLRSLFSHR